MRKLILVFLIAASAYSVKAQVNTSSLTLRDIHGRKIRLADFKGRVVLLNFWAPWCQPCRMEIPDLVKRQRQYRNAGLRIVGVAYPPEKPAEVRSFARRFKLNYPTAIGTKETKKLFTSSETLPITVVIDREGVTRAVIVGIMYADEFDEKVRPLLVSSSRSKVQNTTRSAEPGGVKTKGISIPAGL
jgi:thiol-disulfide isomerase/thioredoxin